MQAASPKGGSKTLGLDRVLTPVPEQGVQPIEGPLDPGCSTAWTGLAVTRAKQKTPHSAALQFQELPNTECVDARQQALRQITAARAPTRPLTGGEGDPDALDPVLDGGVLPRDRPLGARWRTEPAAVAELRVDAQPLIVDDPGPGRTGVDAGATTRLLHPGMDAARRDNLRQQQVRRH
jgi:hypothetical protein